VHKNRTFQTHKKQLSEKRTAMILVSTCLYTVADSCDTNIAG